MRSCSIPVGDVKATDKIVTIEGLSAELARIRCRRRGLAIDVPQCGYCQSGQIMAAAALLKKNAEADRRRHRRGDDQHLSLRHLSAHPRRRAHGGRRWRDARAPTQAGLRRAAMTQDDIRQGTRSSRAASSSSAPPPRGGGLALGFNLPFGVAAAQRAGAARGTEVNAWVVDQARRHLRDPHRALRDGPGHAHRPRPARRRRARVRLEEGRRPRRSRPARTSRASASGARWAPAAAAASAPRRTTCGAAAPPRA